MTGFARFQANAQRSILKRARQLIAPLPLPLPRKGEGGVFGFEVCAI